MELALRAPRNTALLGDVAGKNRQPKSIWLWAKIPATYDSTEQRLRVVGGPADRALGTGLAASVGPR